jgi:hypothetical protein
MAETSRTFTEMPFDWNHATSAVVTVGPRGNAGRGFVMEMMDPLFQENSIHRAGKVCLGPRFVARRIIVTAAHCLPYQPPPAAIVGAEEKTYFDLISGLGGPASSVAAECLFADPVSDLAVLGEPDDQQWPEASDAYLQVVEAGSVLTFRSDKIKDGVRGWLLSLDGRWNPCVVEAINHCLWITEAREGIFGGMSGSPILVDDGSVIGVLCSGSGTSGMIQYEGGPQPRLSHCLPAGLFLSLIRK